MRFFDKVKSFILSLPKKSFRTHGAVPVSDLETAIQFYRQFGFREVIASRADEVVLLRNHRGDELNLLSLDQPTTHVEYESDDVTSLVAQSELQGVVSQDSASLRVRFEDPDGNVIEFFEMRARVDQANDVVFHFVAKNELEAGLSDHYYMPPVADRRFVYADRQSAFLEMALAQANDTLVEPFVLELDVQQLSFRDEFEEDVGRDKIGKYPQVNSPIVRGAIVSGGRLEDFPDLVPFDSFYT